MTKMNKKSKKAILFTFVMVLPIGLLISSASSNLQLSAADTFRAYKSSSELTLDGIGDEAAWGSATPLVVTTAPGIQVLANTQVTLKAVYTSAHIYILASWADSTLSITRDKYNVSGGVFDADLAESNSEDRIAFLWEIGTVAGFNSSGCQTKCHTLNGPVNFTGDDEIADMWHVKAARGGGVTSATIDADLTIEPASYEAIVGTVVLNGYADDTYVDNTGRHSDTGLGSDSDNTNGTQNLIIESNNTGLANAFTISDVSGNAIVGTDTNTISTEAQDAVYSVDGVDQTSVTNTIYLDDGMVTVNLKGAGEAVLKVAPDENEVNNAISTFVSEINSFIDFNKNNSDYIKEVVLSSVNSFISDHRMELESLGITQGEDGKLEIDSDKLAAAVNQNLSGIKEIFGGFDGLAVEINSYASQISTDSPLNYAKEAEDMSLEFADYLYSASAGMLQQLLAGSILNTHI